MIVLLQLASLMILKLFSCTEMKSPEGHLPLSDIHPRAASVISSYLDNPGSVDGHFSELYRADLASKRIFIDIPELIADDIDKNERELKFILLNFSKYTANPDYLYHALRSEFLHGNKFDAVLPNLMRYFDRYQPVRCKTDEIKVLIRNNKFDYIFHDAPDTLKTLTMVLHQDNNLIFALQEFIVANPAYIERIGEMFSSSWPQYFLGKWINIALVSNMPMIIFEVVPRYPRHIFSSPSIFTGIYIAEENYRETFDKVNVLINNSHLCDEESSNERQRNYFRLLNWIRYGPEDPSVLDEIIRLNDGISRLEKLELCHCAVLAKKKDISDELWPSVLKNITIFTGTLRKYSIDGPLEMHKLIFDVHANYEFIRQDLYLKTDFIDILSKYYRVAFMKLNEGNDLIVEFKIAVDADTSVFPESLMINYVVNSQDKLKKILKEMTFDNADGLENFLMDFLLTFSGSTFDVNAENLSLIMKSESIRGLIYQFMEMSIIPHRPLIVSFVELSKFNDEFDFPLSDIAQERPNEYFPLSNIKCIGQFRNIESLLGKPISTLMISHSNYFEVRHVFEYIIKSGQPLPHNISESTRELLKIDFPQINL